MIIIVIEILNLRKLQKRKDSDRHERIIYTETHAVCDDGDVSDNDGIRDYSLNGEQMMRRSANIKNKAQTRFFVLKTEYNDSIPLRTHSLARSLIRLFTHSPHLLIYSFTYIRTLNRKN